ncbi:MAG: ABC transporter permease [Actinomycetota bacterium]
MPEIRYTALPELRHPERFLAAAAQDFRAAFLIAWHMQLGHIRARHRSSRLASLWHLVPTVATTLACIHLRSLNVVTASPTELPYPVFVLAGVILWQVFLDALNAPLQHLSTARQMITRSTIPHEAIMVAGLLDVLMNCALRWLILAGALIAFGVPVAPTALLIPLGIGSLVLMGFTLGLLATPFGLLYEDIERGISAIAMLWFFLTPVAYVAPKDSVLAFNPLTPLIQTSRAWLLGPSPMGDLAAVTVGNLVFLVLAWLLYRLARPHIVARLG